ncbi:MAG TPA: hypothetical protein VGD40_08590 [Chryseosolibacter sp.]
MNYDFFADKADKIEVLNFIFRDTDFHVYDLGSPYGEKINRYSSAEEIVSKFDLINGDKFAVAFQLWAPASKGAVIFRQVNLDPKYCKGHTFRYATEGLGLIQLYFGGTKNNELHPSHIGHFSQRRVLAGATTPEQLAFVNQWDWKEVEKAGRKLSYQIKKMSVRKSPTGDVLPAAEKLLSTGITLR